MTNVVRFPKERRPLTLHPATSDARFERAPDVRHTQALAGLSFDAWVEANRDRIWRALMAGDRRDMTFWDFARALWAQC